MADGRIPKLLKGAAVDILQAPVLYTDRGQMKKVCFPGRKRAE
jgi:hypothetical protein